MIVRPNLPWVGYIRVSTKDQAQKFSPVKQLMAEASWAKANGVVIPGIDTAVVGDAVRPSEFILLDKQTGKNDDRPGFQRAMELARAGKIGGMVGFTVDRCARNVVDAIKLRTTLKKMGVKLDFATQTFDYSPSGAMMYAMFAAFAEYEGQIILERTSNGRLARVQGNPREGIKPRLHSGGAVLYGYRYLDGFPVVDDKESVVAVHILRSFEEGETAYKIFQRLNREGYRTRKGKKFFHGTVVQLLRKADQYAGSNTHHHGIEAAKREYVERVEILGENAAPLDLSSVQIIQTEDFYPPLISRESAARIKAKLTQNKTEKAGAAPTKHLLAKMLFCLNGDHKWHPRWTRTGGAYKCGDVNRHDAFQKICRSRQVSCIVLDNEVLNAMRDYLRQPEVAHAMAMQDYEASEGPAAQQHKRELEKRLHALDREQAHLDKQMMDYELPERTRNLAKKRLKEVEVEMLELKGELKQASVTVLPAKDAVIAAFTELLGELDHLETFEEKREFIEATVSRVRTDGEAVEIEGNIALEVPSMLRDRNFSFGSDPNFAAYIPFILKRKLEGTPRRNSERTDRRVA